MAKLALYLFGPPILKADGVRVEIGRRKALALLIYLALTGQSHSRDALATLFWPERGQSQARANLRRSLFTLNQSLGEGLVLAEREVVSLMPSCNLYVDVVHFQQLLDECKIHGHDERVVCSECLALLSDAVSLYNSDFLFGFNLPDCREFDAWQLFYGEKLRGELSVVLKRLSDCYRERGLLYQALAVSQRRLVLDPMEESAHVELIGLYASIGQKAAALRQYEECERVFKDELHVEPSDDTRRLVQSIRENTFPRAAAKIQQKLVSEHNREPPKSGVASQELRLVTVVVSGPSIYLEAEDGQPSEEYVSRATNLNKTCVSIFGAYGALIEPSFAEDTIAVFGILSVHEDDAERAVRAAIEVRRATTNIGLAVSIGIQTGVAYVARESDQECTAKGILGPVYNRAVQLRYRAEAGQILAAESTYCQSRGAVDYAFRSVIPIGTAKPILAYAATNIKLFSRKTHGIEGLQAAFVGRDEPLRKLKEAAAQVLQGRGRVVSIVGEAGIGKSRLVTELRDDPLIKGANFLWLEGRCQELGMSASYWPFQDMLRTCFGWNPADDNRKRAHTLIEFLYQMKEEALLSQAQVDEIGPLFGGLLSVQFAGEWDERLKNADSKQIRHRTLQALRIFLLALSKRKPLVLVFEDLHWADSLSLDVLALLMEAIGKRAILLLCVYRLLPTHRSRDFGTQASRICPGSYCALLLEELKPPESQALVESLLHIERLSPSIKALVLAKAQGNPFFLEEVVRSLIDTKVIERQGERWVTKKEIRAVPIPENVRNVLQSRIERLEFDSRSTLQVASIIGPFFASRVLMKALSSEVDLDSVLQNLVRAVLIYEERASPEPRFAFKHVLVQETVYQMIPPSRKTEFHGRVADAIEVTFQDNLEEHCEEIAYHFERSADGRKAVEYLIQAGEKARRQFLNVEAIEFFSRALEWLKRSEFPGDARPWRLKALKALGRTYEAAGIIEKSVDIYRTAIQEAKAWGWDRRARIRELATLYHGLAQGLDSMGGIEELKKVTAEGLSLVEDEGESLEAALINSLAIVADDPWTLTDEPDSRGISYSLRNTRFVNQLAYSEELVFPYINIARTYALLKNQLETERWLQVLRQRAEANHDLRALGLIEKEFGNLVDYYQGDPGQAVDHFRKAAKIFRKIGDDHEYGYNLAMLGWMFEWSGDLSRAAACARLAESFCLVSGDPVLLADCHRNLATALICDGAVEEGVKLLYESLIRYRQNIPELTTHGLIPIANAFQSMGRAEEAIELFLEALKEMSENRGGDTPVEEWRMYRIRAFSGLEEAVASMDALQKTVGQHLARCQAADKNIGWQWHLEPAEIEHSDSPSVEERFQGGLSADWTWYDPKGGCGCDVGNGCAIYACNGRSLWALSVGAPRLLRSVSGEFVCQAVCTSVADTIPAIGGLVLWKDRDNFLGLEHGKFGRHDIMLKGCLNNKNVFCGRGRLPGSRIFLRVERSAGSIRALCSEDGQEWFQVARTPFPVEDPLQVGLFASGWIDRTIYPGAFPEGAAIKFESFQLWKG